MRKVACLSLVLLAACSSLSEEERQQLASYQSNAALYWEGGRLENARQMVESGLALDPIDYKLSTMKGMISLRQASDESLPQDRRQRLLAEAQQQLGEVYSWRDPNRHDGFLLLGYGMAHEAQGLRLQKESIRERDSAARAGGEASAEGRERLAAATAREEEARAELLAAREVLSVLLERGELVLLAHYHLMQVAAALEEPAAVFQHGNDYLGEVDRSKQVVQDDIKRTSSPVFERARKRELERIRDQELDVRTFLASLYYDRGDYQAALRHLDAVLIAEPGRTADYFNRARCLARLQRQEEAKDDFRRFIATSKLPASNPKMIEAVQALGQ